ncbi:MAG: hypothetical protein AB7K36_06910 [Chloroflexota bacterium]
MKRQSSRAIKWSMAFCRWVGGAARLSNRRVTVAILLGVALANLLSPDLQTFGTREALAAGPAVEHVRPGSYLDGYTAPGSCDKDHSFQEAFSWDDLLSYFTAGPRPLYNGVYKIGYCIEKPRTTRPGVNGGNRWDYWADYWDRERHRNDSLWDRDWWGR